MPVSADSGTIDSKELRAAMQALGHNPAEEELYVMMSLVHTCSLICGVKLISSIL